VPRRGYLFAAAVSGAPAELHEQRDTLATAPRLSIVVLPFANLSGDPEQDYFVDGITEGLTTDLSRIPGAFVIARNTAFAYKGKAADSRQVGRELGVRYVMEGSVQTGRERLRVNAQLIDAESGAHLWAERFDKPRADLFDMQDEITTRLARTVGIELVAAESLRAERERPNSMDAVDLTMRGNALHSSISLERERNARSLFESALRLDDRNVGALLGLAQTHYYEVITFVSDKPAEQLRIADAAASKALALAPNNALAHVTRAMVLQAAKAPERALRECEVAIGLDRNLADAHALAGAMKIFLGRAEETEGHIVEAMRLSPRDTLLRVFHLYIGAANFYLGQLDRAVDHLRKSVEISPDYEIAYFYLAGALALLDRHVEGAEALVAGQRLSPGFSISRFRTQAIGNNPIYLAQRERLYAGMRKAGVPEE
jgi:TolB-like protein/Tfp pilus assembly protein PilF